MGTTNFEKFKQRLEASTKPEKSSSWFKPVNGKRHVMRFLPLKHENYELPIAMYHHHGLTFPDGHFESIPCNKKLGAGECPFCQAASEMYRKYTTTEDKKFLEAAKNLFPKSHYLLVGFEVTELTGLNPSDITAEHVKIVRASSKANMELLDAKLLKGVDFVDPDDGRNVTLFKNTPSGKNAITTITWDFDDPSPAFTGRNAAAMWKQLLEVSPDLSSIVNPASAETIKQKFADWQTTPVATEDETDDVTISSSASLAPPKPTSRPVAAASSNVAEVDDEMLARLKQELE